MLKLFPRVIWVEGTAVTVKMKKKKGFISILERKMNGIPPIIEEKTASNVNGQSTSVPE